jgi:hypothetical protein
VRGAIYRRLEQDARLADEDPWAPRHPSSTELRRAVAEACWEILCESFQARGCCPFAVCDAFDQARCDLRLFVLQHRLPKRAFPRLGARR